MPSVTSSRLMCLWSGDGQHTSVRQGVRGRALGAFVVAMDNTTNKVVSVGSAASMIGAYARRHRGNATLEEA